MNEKKNQKLPIFVCMGSACHQLGVYQVLPVMESLLIDAKLNEVIELRGAFCLGSCMHGIVMKFGDQFFGDINLNNIKQKFQEEMLPVISAELQLS